MAVVGARAETGTLMECYYSSPWRWGPEKKRLERKGLFSLKKQKGGYYEVKTTDLGD